MFNDLYRNIPDELKQLNQWVNYRTELTEEGGTKTTKRPYNPATGRLASVTDPATWVPFEFARSAAMEHPEWYDGIGFVLTQNDPYCFVDLDDTQGDQEKYERQLHVYREMNTYAEVSPSGKGCHLILKGSVPSGRRRDKIELYSSERYMTMTGNVVGGVAMPINDTKQEVIDILWQELGGKEQPESAFDFGMQYPEQYTDEQIIEFCTKTSNGEMFEALWHGRWQGAFPSQSEADFTLCRMFALYTNNIKQLERLFLSSELGRRDKAKRHDYLYHDSYGILKLAFNKKLPPLDFSQLKQAFPPKPPIYATNEYAQLPRADDPTAPLLTMDNTEPRGYVNLIDDSEDGYSEYKDKGTGFITTCPPGLFGEMATFFYAQAKYPVSEYAVTGALAYASGILARSNNISKMGLNQYFVNVGGTGTGKEGPVSGISALSNRIAQICPSAAYFLGPSELASKEAALRELQERPCFVSIMGEIGKLMQGMFGFKASPSVQGLERLLLEIYGKSGNDHIWNGLSRAKKDTSTQGIRAVNLSLIGDTTPDGFYRHLTPDNIRSGLFPRFTIVENYGERPMPNRDFENVYPNPDLVSYMAGMCKEMHERNMRNICINIMIDPVARKYLDDFEAFCDDKVRGGKDDTLKELWTRTNMRALKTAATIAAFNNYHAPLLTLDIAQWSVAFIENTTNNLIHRSRNFTLGDSYKHENAQYRELMRVCMEWLNSSWIAIATHKRGSVKLHKDGLIPFSYMSKRLLGLRNFREDRMGATYAIKRAVEAAVLNGDLIRMRELEIMEKYEGKVGMCYKVNLDKQDS